MPHDLKLTLDLEKEKHLRQNDSSVRVELFITCSELVSLNNSKSNKMCVLYGRKFGQWHEMAQTESLSNTSELKVNPIANTFTYFMLFLIYKCRLPGKLCHLIILSNCVTVSSFIIADQMVINLIGHDPLKPDSPWIPPP